MNRLKKVFLEWLLGPEEKREPISQTRFSDIDLEGALSEAERIHDLSEGITHGPTLSYLLQLSIYHKLVAIAKEMDLPNDNSLIMESDRLYARTDGTNNPFKLDYLMGEANYNLATAVEHHLRGSMPKPS